MIRNSLLLVLILLCTLPVMAIIQTGVKAPCFKVVDGNEKALFSTDLKGKVIIGFYESRETSDKNKTLKDMLNSFGDYEGRSVKNETFSLAIIDATDANLASAWVWRRNMVKKSTELGIHIYGDWDGRMKRDFLFPDNESTFIIIDKKNIIRYTCCGKVPESEFGNIKILIKKIYTE